MKKRKVSVKDNYKMIQNKWSMKLQFQISKKTLKWLTRYKRIKLIRKAKNNLKNKIYIQKIK